MTSLAPPHETQRIRLPSVNDIFPTNHQSVPTNSSTQSAPRSIIVHSPVPMSPVHQASNGAILIPIHLHQQLQQQQQQQHSFPAYYQNIQVGVPINVQPIPQIGVTGSPIYTTNQPAPRQHFCSPSISPSNNHYTNTNSRYKVAKPNQFQSKSASASPNGNNARQSNAWSYDDDCLLKYLKEVRNLGWREISLHFKNRTANGCQFRWRRINALSKANMTEQDTKTKQIGADTSSQIDSPLSPTPSVASSRSNSLESLLN